MANCGQVECSKRGNKQDESIDRISTLPDELLVLILSSRPVKEAVSTSILSCRWRYMWTFVTKLDFDGSSSIVNRVRRSVHESERLNYVGWVNRVIALHKSPKIEEFRVLFDLTKTYQNSIDEWVRFALTKKVEKLELNLTANARSTRYTFDPFNLLWSDSLDHVKYLKKIFLSNVNVSNEALAFFSCNCPLLEHLSVSECEVLMRLKIIGQFPSLKRLEIIINRWSSTSVEIRGMNLVYLKYVGPSVDFVVENLPLLVEMCIGRQIRDINNVLLTFANHIPQLEILTLDTTYDPYYGEIQDLCSSVKKSNLKQLTVKGWIDHDQSLIDPLTNLLQASPCLQIFVLEVHWRVYDIERNARNVWPVICKMKARKGVCSYPRLKEIRFVQYQGVPCELELLEHFLANAGALEKVLIDTRITIHRLEDWEKTYLASHDNKLKEIIESARSRAIKELPVILPPKVTLTII